MAPDVQLVEPQEAVVDDITLSSSDRDSTGLTDDQINRLKEVPGVKLEVLGEQQDEFDVLKGEKLKEAVEASGIEGLSSKTADEQRAALREAAQNADNGGDS